MQNDDPKVIFNYLLLAYRNSPDNSFLKNKYKEDLYSLKAGIDLACLNGKHIKCQKKDFKGNFYVKNKLGKYRALEKFRPFKLNLSKNKSLKEKGSKNSP